MIYERGFLPEFKSAEYKVAEDVTKSGKKFVFLHEEEEDQNKTPPPKNFREFLAQRSKVYGVFRALKRFYYFNYVFVDKDIHFSNDWKTVKKLEGSVEGFWAFDGGKSKSVLNISSDLAALDTNDPRIAEGLRIALDVFSKMNDKAISDNVGFIVLLIPTKELVFKDYVLQKADQIPIAYRDSVEKQSVLWKKITDHLDRNHIQYVDPLPALRKALVDGPQPFPISANSHLNSEGHKLIAKLIRDTLNKNFSGRLQTCLN